MTPYSPEGRHFSKSVRDYWHIIENNPRLHSIWPNCPFTSHRKKKISQGHLFVISIQSYPSQHHLLTGTPFDKGNLVCGMSASPNLKPTYRSLLSHTSWSSISYPPYTHKHPHTHTHTHIHTLLSRYKHRASQTTWFGLQTVNLLNHVPAFSSQEQ